MTPSSEEEELPTLERVGNYMRINIGPSVIFGKYKMRYEQTNYISIISLSRLVIEIAETELPSLMRC